MKSSSASKDPNKISLFDWLHTIKSSKTDLMNEDTMPSYEPFMIKRGLGMSIDILEDAHKAQLLNLPKDLEYRYLLHKVTRGFRRDAWPKKTKDDEAIQVIKEYYQVGNERAMQYLRLLNSSQIEELKSRMDLGGRKR